MTVDAGRGRSLAIVVVILVWSACRVHSTFPGPRRLSSAMSKPPIRAPAAPPKEPVPPPEPAAESPPEPTPEPPPAPGSVESADGNEEPERRPPKELRRKSFGSLPRPLYLKSYLDGICGGALAVDGVGRIWSESGCRGSRLGRGLQPLTADPASAKRRSRGGIDVPPALLIALRFAGKHCPPSQHEQDQQQRQPGQPSRRFEREGLDAIRIR